MSAKKFGWALAALSLLTLTACATLRPKASFVGIGNVDPDRDQTVTAQIQAALRADPRPAVPEIIVLLDTVPEGLTTEKGALQVQAGYAHKILGKFEIAPQYGLFYLMAWFFDYEDTWRKGLCYWQVPLEWVTIGFWSLVPTSYLCHPSAGMRPKAVVVRDVKTLAASAGADLVMMSYTYFDETDAAGAVGVLIQMDPKLKGGELKTSPATPPKGPVTNILGPARMPAPSKLNL